MPTPSNPATPLLEIEPQEALTGHHVPHCWLEQSWSRVSALAYYIWKTVDAYRAVLCISYKGETKWKTWRHEKVLNIELKEKNASR